MVTGSQFDVVLASVDQSRDRLTPSTVSHQIWLADLELQVQKFGVLEIIYIRGRILLADHIAEGHVALPVVDGVFDVDEARLADLFLRAAGLRDAGGSDLVENVF